MRRICSDLLLLLLAIALVVGFSSYLHQVFSPLRDEVDIDLSLWHLPEYTFYSLSRGLVAYAFSLIFSLSWGFWAAKDRVVEKAVIPLLDILQSIPFLGFLPGVVLLFVGIFQRNNVGLEFAAILLMFTSQVWNMAFGVYHSIRTVPLEKSECATAYRFSTFQRFRWVELPFTSLSLIWNSIMSVAGGWFFLMINEAFKLGSRDFRLPGLGSYMSVAASKGDVLAMTSAIIAMIAMIVFLDQLLWRPLVVWSQKFRVEETAPPILTESWFLNVIKRSYFAAFLRSAARTLGRILQDKKIPKKNFPVFQIVSRAALLLLLLLLAVALFYVLRLLKDVSWEQWLYLSAMLSLTFVRVLICVLISVLVMLPIGLAIGLSDKYSRVLQPIIQVSASFPATLLFPALIVLFKFIGIPLGIGSVLLMLMGTQWYVLFNVMAGAKAMPSDLKEVAKSFHFRRAHRFLWLYLPAVFPYLVTGVLSAAGGAWNASIVSEYATYKDQVWTTPGIGSSISLAAQNNDFPLLAASIAILVVVVIGLNYQVWLRLYHYSEKRFALNA
jgi:NitT/TauT family transport system permease protein